MADTRFFTKPNAYHLGVIAARTGCELAFDGDTSYEVSDVSTLADAGAEHLAFLDNKKYRDQFAVTKAGAVIIHPDMVPLAPQGVRLLLSKTPYKSYALAAQIFYPEERPSAAIADSAKIDATAKIGKDVVIEDFVVIGANVEIGDGTWVESHATIGKGCIIGSGCRVGSHTSVSHAVIGHKTRLYPGVRVGQDGFGFAIDPSGFVKVPQLGRVLIGNGVEIGANTTVDRGTSGDTVIGDGTWIDNLVQIGHNVKMGRGCVLAAQTGISGSTELGDFVVMGGQVGVAGHLKIGAMARVAAKSGVTKDIPAKEEWMGYPALPMKRCLRQAVILSQLVDKHKKEA